MQLNAQLLCSLIQVGTRKSAYRQRSAIPLPSVVPCYRKSQRSGR
jgi:hypothetical protein